MQRQICCSLFLLLLLLLLCCAHGCAATAVVQELPHSRDAASRAYTVSTNGRQLIRIVTSTRDLENKKRYCSEVGMSVRDFEGGSFRCDTFNVLKEEDVQHLRDVILPAAVKLHADRLLVKRVVGPLVVPEFEDDSVCSYFTVPVSHHCRGVNDSDMVLYVAAKPGGTFAIPCARDESRRPIAAGVNLAFYRKFGLRYNVRVAAHEIAHALGFNYEDMLNANMLSNVTTPSNSTRLLVISNKTMEKAKAHYKCNDLKGMELVYTGKEKYMKASHWAHRIAKDELMSSYILFGAGYYTALTMASFEDLKYYTANWGMEEPMTWGNNSGCGFINDTCDAKKKNPNISVFCQNTAPRCTSDRFAVGTCGSSNGYRVYTAKEEECPFAKPEYISTSYGVLPALCTLVVNDTIPGSLMGNDSWCLDGESLKVKDRVKAEGKDVGGVCARVKCGDDGVVMVMYAGNNEWHNCTQGGFIMPSNSSSFVSGKIKCPRFSEVCTMRPNGGSRLVPKTSREGQESTADVTHSQGRKREQQGAGVNQSTLRNRKRSRNLKTGNNSSVRVRGTVNRTNKEH